MGRSYLGKELQRISRQIFVVASWQVEL